MRPVVVVKCGGTDGVAEDLVCADLLPLAEEHRVVLVHGGSAETGRLAERLGVPQRFHTSASGVSFRHTDTESLDVLTMALAGRVKPRIVATLARAGLPAVGLTGIDGGLLRAAVKADQVAVVDGRRVVVRGGRSGRIDRVDTGVLGALLGAGLVPVVSPPALGDDGGPVNVNADRVAAALAVALGATALVLLTGAPGVLADPGRGGTPLAEVALAPGSGAVRIPGVRVDGGMGLKLIAAREAVTGGVPTVVIADGGVAAPVRAALAGAGTRVRPTGNEVAAR